MATISSLVRVAEYEITALDLREELDEPGTPYLWECYVARIDDDAERVQVIYCPRIGRGAVAWGADADWSDADGPRDLVTRVIITGEVRV